jgi:hypothetical protein
MSGALIEHRARARELPRARIEYLCPCQCRPNARPHATGYQHAAVGQQRRGMFNATSPHTAR